jgi:hypothetical protein
MLPGLLSSPTTSQASPLRMDFLRSICMGNSHQTELVWSRLVDRLGSLGCDVAVAPAWNSPCLLATDGRMDRFIVVLGDLLSSVLVDFQAALLGFQISLGIGMRCGLDDLRTPAGLRHHWVCLLLACPFSDPLADCAANR